MASAFWTPEDGRGFPGRWSGMAYLLELIVNELKNIQGAASFYEYIEPFVYREEQGDVYNGYGGFIRNDKNILFNVDLRSVVPVNRQYFWQAAQNALMRQKREPQEKKEPAAFLLTTLLDMHKRIKKGEDPMLLNHMEIIGRLLLINKYRVGNCDLLHSLLPIYILCIFGRILLTNSC